MLTRINHPFQKVFALLAAVCLLMLAGCVIKQDKKEDSEKVEIKSPLGNLKVDGGNVQAGDVGLSVYPNAKLKPKPENDKEANNANVNIDTPFFTFRVIAMDYLSDDPPQKIVDFYKKDMARYGKVLECDKTSSNGQSIHSKSGDMKLELTCDDTGPGNNTELKAGQGSSQRVVGIKPNGSGSEFGLVYLQVHGSQETM